MRNMPDDLIRNINKGLAERPALLFEKEAECLKNRKQSRRMGSMCRTLPTRKPWHHKNDM